MTCDPIYLLEFFPDVDVDRIAKLDQFHKDITKVLRKEFDETESRIQSTIDYAKQEHKHIENEIRRIKEVPNVSVAAMERYSEINQELTVLKEANENFKVYAQLKKDYKEYREQLEAAVEKEIAGVEQSVNKEMESISTVLVGSEYYPPKLTIPDANRYYFRNPKDSGAGNKYKGLIIFDLAMQELTNIPVLVHDSILFKQIDKDVVSEIVKYYNTLSKQVFISIDEQVAYTEEAINILDDTCVLRLSEGGNELFGRSWNKKTTGSEINAED